MCRAELNGISSGATFCLSAFLRRLIDLADYSISTPRYPSTPAPNPVKIDTTTSTTATITTIITIIFDLSPMTSTT